MKISVDVEIDWIDEDYTVNEQVAEDLKRGLANKIYTGIEPTVIENIRADIKEQINTLMAETYNSFLSQGIIVYDKWGEKIKEEVNIKGMLKEKLDKFMTEQVDKNGKPSNYSSKERYVQLIERQGEKQIQDFIKSLSDSVIASIKKDINENIDKEAQQRVTRAILSSYGLKDLIK